LPGNGHGRGSIRWELLRQWRAPLGIERSADKSGTILHGLAAPLPRWDYKLTLRLPNSRDGSMAISKPSVGVAGWPEFGSPAPARSQSRAECRSMFSRRRWKKNRCSAPDQVFGFLLKPTPVLPPPFLKWRSGQDMVRFSTPPAPGCRHAAVRRRLTVHPWVLPRTATTVRTPLCDSPLVASAGNTFAAGHTIRSRFTKRTITKFEIQIALYPGQVPPPPPPLYPSYETRAEK